MTKLLMHDITVDVAKPKTTAVKEMRAQLAEYEISKLRTIELVPSESEHTHVRIRLRPAEAIKFLIKWNGGYSDHLLNLASPPIDPIEVTKYFKRYPA